MLNILLVEDDDVAAEAVARSLGKHHVHFPITLAQDGLEALQILKHTHTNLSISKPYVVLLDLNMPRMNGFEFLEKVRSDDALRESIVFVLTTSDNENDRTQAYNNCIAGYMVKSAVGPQYSKLVNLLEQYKDTIKFPL